MDTSSDGPDGEDTGDTEAPTGRRSGGEGVRILGAEEAGEVAARGDTGRRREPRRRADTPETPDDDERPLLRFPTPLESRDPSSFGAVPVVRAGDPPLEAEVPAESSEASGDPVEEPGFELPHYSDPPTGQVPRVVIAESEEQSESWSGLSAQPRWRDQDHGFDDPDFSDLVDDGPRLGALDEPTDGAAEFFGDDLDAPTSGFGDDEELIPATRRQAARTAVRRPRSGGRGGGGGDAFAASTSRNVPLAVGVGAALFAVGVLCFALGAVATTVLITVILVIAGVELFSTLRASGYHPATLLGLAAVAGLAVAPLARPQIAYPVVLALTVIAGLLWYLYVSPGHDLVTNLSVTLLGVLWIGGLGSIATLLLGIGREAQDAAGLDSNPGIGVLFAAVAVTLCYDIGAFFGGRSLGRTPLSSASPNKTREGLLIGLAAALFIPLIVLTWLPGVGPVGDEFAKAFPFCLFCALMAPAGDLCESAVKRDLGVKDMGDLLPGHGGVLDRFDALLFVLPTAWFMAHLLEIGPF
jgi:phosphatidate cytidylyltransferase